MPREWKSGDVKPCCGGAHPDLGVISPAVFIPLAEQNGLMVAIGEWVLLTACADNKSWQDRGFKPLPVSVKFIRGSVVQRAAKYGHQLFTANRDGTPISGTGNHGKHRHGGFIEVIEILQQLKDYGVHTSIDDFGHRVFFIESVKDLPVDGIKIDGSFIWGIGRIPRTNQLSQ